MIPNSERGHTGATPRRPGNTLLIMPRGLISSILRAAVAFTVLTLPACGSEPDQVVQQDSDQHQKAQAEHGEIPKLPSVSPEAAVAGFDADQVDHSLARLALSIARDPAGTRAVALDSWESTDEAVRLAALLALAATAEAGESLEALKPFLSSERRSERLLAASRLASQGEKSALPILIEALDSEKTLGFSAPPEPAWRFARRALLMHTERDFGLRAAEDAESAAVTRGAWDVWWDKEASSLSWDAEARRFSAGKPGSGES